MGEQGKVPATKTDRLILITRIYEGGENWFHQVIISDLHMHMDSLNLWPFIYTCVHMQV